MDWYITEKEMEAERESLYKAIGYAKGEALEPFTKEVISGASFVHVMGK